MPLVVICITWTVEMSFCERTSRLESLSLFLWRTVVIDVWNFRGLYPVRMRALKSGTGVLMTTVNWSSYVVEILQLIYYYLQRTFSPFRLTGSPLEAHAR